MRDDAAPSADWRKTELGAEVRRLLAHLHDLPYLQTHPLGRRLAGSGHSPPRAAHRLQQQVLDAIEELRRPARPGFAADERVYRVLHARYVEARPVAEACQRLGLSQSEYYRLHNRGVTALLAILGVELAEPPPTVTPNGHRPGPAATVAVAPALVSRALPRPRTSFVDRDHEVVMMAALLAPGRLVTLVGPPGVGKSRLAVETARSLAPRFLGRTVFAALDDTRSPEQALAMLTDAVLGRAGPAEPALASLTRALGGAPALLILDNVEQVRDFAPTVAALLDDCPRLAILATGRTALRVHGERCLPVPPLRVPRPDESRSVEQLLACASVRLLVERATDRDPDYVVTAADAPAIAAIATGLEGLPLALELAAAWLVVLGAEGLRQRLADALDLLADGARDRPPRQRALRTAIAGSYDLLPPNEQQLFRYLAAFPGGFTLAAAEAVAPVAAAGGGVPERLAGLVAQSLVQVVPSETGERRYRLLEPLAAFARERLAAAGETAAAWQAHAAYFRSLLDAAAVEVHHRIGWLERLDTERANFDAMLDRLIGERDLEGAARAATVLHHVWGARGHLAHGSAWCARVLERLPADSAARPALLHAATKLAFQRGDLATAERLAGERLTLARAGGDRAASATALFDLGHTAGAGGDLPRARAAFAESWALAVAARERVAAANAHNGLGLLAWREGDLGRAARHHRAALRLWRALGDLPGVAFSCYHLARVALDRGRLAAARSEAEESLAGRERLGDRLGAAYTRGLLGRIALAEGDRSAARVALLAGLREQRDAGDDPLALAVALLPLARLTLADDPAAAVVLAGSVAATYLSAPPVGRAAGTHPSPSLSLPDRADLEDLLRRARAILPPDQYVAAWTTGLATPLEGLTVWEEGDGGTPPRR